MIRIKALGNAACENCKKIEPILMSLKRDGFLLDLISDRDSEKKDLFNDVEIIPTVKILLNGEEVYRFVGAFTEEEIREKIQEIKEIQSTL